MCREEQSEVALKQSELAVKQSRLAVKQSEFAMKKRVCGDPCGDPCGPLALSYIFPHKYQSDKDKVAFSHH